MAICTLSNLEGKAYNSVLFQVTVHVSVSALLRIYLCTAVVPSLYLPLPLSFQFLPANLGLTSEEIHNQN